MAQAYCLKEKTKREVNGAHEVRLRNGRRAIEGSCPSCGIKLFRILGSNEAWTGSGIPFEAKAGSDAVSTTVQPAGQATITNLEPALTELSYRPQDLDTFHAMLLASPPSVQLLQDDGVQPNPVVADTLAVPEQATPSVDVPVSPEANNGVAASA